MPRLSSAKVGVYVDTANMYMNGGQRMRYDVLREFASRDGSELVRLNAYVSYDPERAKTDAAYGSSVKKFHSVLRDFGYKVIIKEVKWYEDEAGKRFGKANADLDLAVDLLQQSVNLDKIVLVTGDGDFARVVEAAQSKGCRVEIISLDNGSSALRAEADMFMSGFLIPNLVPTNGGTNGQTPTAHLWGDPGSRVRGVCYFHKHDYGFMRFIGEMTNNLWVTDTKREDSPYQTAYFHDSNLPQGINPEFLPSYSSVFEFDICESAQREGTFEAKNVVLKSMAPR